MQTIVEFAPWVVFFLVYKFVGGIYPATAVLMGCMVLLLAYDWLHPAQDPDRCTSSSPARCWCSAPRR